MTAKRIRLLRFEIADEAGAVQSVMEQTAAAGINLLCVIAFPHGDGSGEVYAVPSDEADLFGFEQVDGIHLIAPDYCGAGADALQPLRAAGINVRCCFAVAEWRTAHVVLLVDQVDRALAVLHDAREAIAA